MNIELGNTTAADIGILTGLDGHRAALANPEAWEARRFGETDWSPYEVWGEWCCKKLANDNTQWRRKVEPKRDALTESFTVSSLSASTVTRILKSGLDISLGATPSSPWSGASVRVTVETADDTEQAQPVCPTCHDRAPMCCSDAHHMDRSDERPGTILTPYQAQKRLDSGLPVEFEGGILDTWESVTGHHACGNGRRYRIPLPKEQPDAPGTIITWQEAQRRVDAGLAVDFHSGDKKWERIDKLVPKEWPSWTYRIPPQPAEAVTTIDELTNDQLKDYLSEARQSAASRLARCIQLVRERGELEKQLASALGSQKAAVAALEQERMHGCWLRNALEMCEKYFGSASVDDLRQHIAKTLRDIDKTAGKESG